MKFNTLLLLTGLTTLATAAAPVYFLDVYDDANCTPSEQEGRIRIGYGKINQCISLDDLDSLRYTSNRQGLRSGCRLVAYGDDDCTGPSLVLEPRGTPDTLAGGCLRDYEGVRFECHPEWKPRYADY